MQVCSVGVLKVVLVTFPGVVLTVAPEVGTARTAYPVTVEPPLLEGADQESESDPEPGVSVLSVGAPGATAYVAVTCAAVALWPNWLEEKMEKVYETPAVRPPEMVVPSPAVLTGLPGGFGVQVTE